MSGTGDLRTLVRKANAAIANSAATAFIEERPEISRFELYHSKMSLCSQKIRAVFADKGEGLVSHDMVIICGRSEQGEVIPAQNYHPDYVRLRLFGRDRLANTLAAGYSGVTSVETEGLDACVVPTLVDHANGVVIVDSSRICRYIEEQFPSCAPLIPKQAAEAERVSRQMSIVDKTPHAALLYGFHPDDDHRPELIKQIMETVYDNKIAALELLIRANMHDVRLVDAYRAKIAKESGGKMASRDPDFQRASRLKAAQIIADLNGQLTSHIGDWVCGGDFSMADLLWGVSLIRMKYLGLEGLWGDYPRVNAYLERLCQRPSLRSEVIRASIESLPPSTYMAGFAA
jgi:glutathione S-transferase